MGLIRGGASFIRFQVSGELPENHAEEFAARIHRYAFRNLDEHSDEERSIGWVNIMDIFDSQFTGQEFAKERYIALSLRIDVRKVPAKALKFHYTEAETRIKESENKQFLSKHRRKEIREEVKLRLLKRVIPMSNTYDMIWNTSTGVVNFASTSAKLGGEFAEYFKKTFDLGLTMLFPYTISANGLEKMGLPQSKLENLQPSDFI